MRWWGNSQRLLIYKPIYEMQSLDAQEKARVSHRRFFLLTLFTSLISLAVAMFTMLYTRKLFEPLIQAQQMIVELSQSSA